MQSLAACRASANRVAVVVARPSPVQLHRVCQAPHTASSWPLRRPWSCAAGSNGLTATLSAAPEEGDASGVAGPGPSSLAFQAQEDVGDRERLRRKRISDANVGKVPWNKGRKHSPGEQGSAGSPLHHDLVCA